MSTVYVVTSGSYSSYSIVAMYSTKKQAQALIDRFPEVDFNEIEVYELDKLDPKIYEGVTRFYVEMQYNGDSNTEVSESHLELEEPPHPPYGHLFPLAPCGHRGWKPPPPPVQHLEVHCWAKDELHAVKIANEIRAQRIASGEWKEPPEEWKP